MKTPLLLSLTMILLSLGCDLPDNWGEPAPYCDDPYAIYYRHPKPELCNAPILVASCDSYSLAIDFGYDYRVIIRTATDGTSLTCHITNSVYR